MFKWLRGRNASRRVGVIESVQLDGKRSVILVRRDNIEHVVMIGGRNDVVIEANIMRRKAPKPARRPVPETKGLPPPGVPTREPVAEPPSKRLDLNLEELTRRLEVELRGSPPRRGHSSPPLRTEPRSSAQSDATGVEVEPASKPRFHAPGEAPRTDDPERDPAPKAVPNDTDEKNPAR
jgi:flagellar protein FliO/FliZ